MLSITARKANAKLFFQIISVESFSKQNRFLNVLTGQPVFQNFDYVIYLLFCQWLTPEDVMSLFKTLAAAGTGCVLCDKDRMVPHRRLFAIACRIRLSEALHNKIPCMFKDCHYASLLKIFRLFGGEPKPAAKFRPS